MNFTPTHGIGDPVYHICDSNTKGRVIDWRYTRSTGTFEYQVTFTHESPKQWFSEIEILKDEQ